MLWMWALVGSAWPCAGLVHGTSLLAESDQASVIFERAADGVHVTYQVVYDGNADDFGWIVPIPGEFVDLQDASADRFETLDGMSAPEVIALDEDTAGGGCSCSKSDAGGRNLGDTAGVEVVAQGFTGAYEYVAVKAGDSADLTAWLSDNGWEAGDTADAIEHYVGLGDTIVAIRVSPDVAATPEEGRTLPPVRIVYSGDQMRFPATMAASAAAAEQRTTVYVVGDGSANVQGWSAEPSPELTGTLDDDGALIWEDHLRARGAAVGYALTWSNQGPDGWTTRFDTIAPREAHTVDPVFEIPGGPVEHHTTIVLSDAEPASSSALGLLPLMGLALWARRRRA